MPTMAAVLAAGAALLSLLRAVRTRMAGARAAAPDAEDNDADGMFWAVFVTATLLFLSSLIAIRYLGFVFAGMLTIAVCGLLFSRRAWLSIVVVSVLFPLITTVLVRQGLGLALP